MFAQSDPTAVRATLASAGYRNIDVTEVEVDLRIGDDPEDATAHLAAMGTGRAVLDTIAEADRSEALAAVVTTLEDHMGADGVHLRGGVLVTTATRPV
jgi:hypothetical protein